jgi:hypothetical protein
MRTQIQIDNLRNVLCRLIGFYAFYLKDEEIDAWGDKFQKLLDESLTWGIKIKIEESKDKMWYEVPFEPKQILCDFSTISKKAYSLMEKYPKILAIAVVNMDSFEQHVFTKGDTF